MLFYFRLRPIVLLPTLTDDVSTTAKTLSPAEDDEHLLEDAVAADGVASLEEFFFSKIAI